jgi:predicted transcriptional regulator
MYTPQRNAVSPHIMAQLTVRIDDDLKGHLQNLARQEGKSTSDVVRGLVQRYVQDRDRGAALRALWNQMKRNAEEAQAGPEDVEEAVRAVREQSRSGPAEDQS